MRADELTRGCQCRSGISAFEAEAIIERLERFQVRDVGSRRWMAQHEMTERLNIQAHMNVHHQNEEFVTEALTTFEKLPLLIRDLLVIETWKGKVYPLVLRELATDSVTLYFTLYHEATIVNLLEIVLFSRSACLSAGDALLDLVDYCARKVAKVTAWEAPSDPQALSGKRILEMSDEELMRDKFDEMEFAICIGAIGIMRYLSEHAAELDLSVVTRMLNTHDMISASVYLIERAPWFERTDKNKFRRYEDGAWRDIPRDELPRLGKVEAQAWLTVYNLCLEPKCRESYEYTTQNQDIILRLKSFITEIMVDQLPVLVHLQRYLEELTILQPPEPKHRPNRSILVELVPEILDEITKDIDWDEVAEYQKTTVFRQTEEDKREMARRLAATYDLSEYSELLDPPKCGKCGKDASQRCSRCKTEWYCSRACQVKAWKTHKGACDMVVGYTAL
ncbi:uncharacterized protein BJ171DRAFT_500882 [Polychytrium aggregatum]|uniref:uncharacterized protein n=1 Tax=Polychytrium aggregatum TaxID=110093 RepID=UPI0022FF3F25|nr:uncharacterized protein BJ171DRAFT_500882 [Polychytrium aggregatum]KAI9205600.1 hypothetical protein BJ171DRAFT_500882 [Polychytrium aggregatum]